MYTKLYNYIHELKAFMNGREYDGDSGIYAFMCCHVTDVRWIFSEVKNYHAEKAGAVLEIDPKGPGRVWIEIYEDTAKIYGFSFSEGAGRGYCIDIPENIAEAIREELSEYYSFIYIDN